MNSIHGTCAAAIALLMVTAPCARADIPAAVKALAAGDFVLAEKELRADADGGNVQAQVLLGRIQRDARNPNRNAGKAFEWFRRAAEAGSAEARYVAGLMAQRGEGTAADPAQAIAWWRQAAEAGYAPAMGVLAASYLAGTGVEKNPTEAVRWARAGADKQDLVSQSLLGRAYMLGEGGLARDVNQALHWTRLAAMQGEPNAQSTLGRLYADGMGVPQNFVQAHLWLNLAAARGQKQAMKQRDELGAKMTAEQLAEAQKLAAAWRPVRAARLARGESAASPGAALRRAGSGSGFIVDAAGSIITNHHVVRNCAEVRIPAHRVTAGVSAVDERNDLALLQASVTVGELPTFRSATKVRLGEAIVVAGFPLGEVLSGGLNVTTGSISALAGPRNNASMLQITAPIQAGNSGGPVLDQSGQIVGVVVSKLNALRIAAVTGDVPQNVNFAINGTVARAFLETNGVELEHEVTTPVAAPTVDVAERAKHYTVLVECWR